MARRVFITGLGPVTAAGIGIEPLWRTMLDGQSAVGPIQSFDATGFATTIGGEVKDLDVRQFVPKTYRKATKVMARDIELAVVAADCAVRDAGLITKGVLEKGEEREPTYPPARVGANIGAGLIAADVDELTAALTTARSEDGSFDIHKWGNEGMENLTPLWLLKYLPNMLACHTTIIHDCRGPSNTITCQEASAGLSLGEALRTIQRDDADAAIAGGADSKLNPMAYLRQLMTGRYTDADNERPQSAVRPFCETAEGCVVGEGGGIVTLEAVATFEKRAAHDGATAYAEVTGFAASQSINPTARNLVPDNHGRGIAIAIRNAINQAGIAPNQINLIIPFGLGHHDYDHAEVAALHEVFGDAITNIPLFCTKPYVGNCNSGSGAVDICIAAKCVKEQKIPAIINCDDPLNDMNCRSAPSREAELNYVLTYAAGYGGQNAAVVLKRC